MARTPEAAHAYYLAHKEKWARIYRPRADAKRPHRQRDYSRRFYVSGRYAAWVAKNRERVKAIKLAYRRRHPDRVQTVWHRYHSRKVGAAGTHTTREWSEKIVLFGGLCAYCGEARRLTRDHRVPLVRGGTNDITNILPACQSCNRKKGVLTDREFLAAAA